MKWPFGDRARFDRPPSAQVIAFPLFGKDKDLREKANKLVEEPRWSFEKQSWTSVDDVLFAARKDLRRGLVRGDAIMVAIYDGVEERIVWYQLGMTNQDIAAALDDWRNAL